MSQTVSMQLTKNSKYKLNNGQYIPVAGFGVYLMPAEKTAELVYQALVEGYRHIDSAVGYYNEREAAQGVAKFLKDHPNVHRRDIWFTTKIRNQDQGYEETKESVKQIAADVKEYIDYVDLVLIHSAKTNKEKRLGTYKALQEFVGVNPVLQIKSIGVSNYGIHHLEELFNWDGYLIKPVVNQVELHPWLPRIELREYCAKLHILLEAYTPLTRGEKFTDPELVQLSQKYKISPADILLKWSYLQGFIVLAKTENPQRIRENLDALPDGPGDAFENPLGRRNSTLGRLDLEVEIIETLNKPNSKEVLTWGGVDPTLCE
ncbi:uncharacterized protein SPAPADRAFT_60276 [Spathaspora passalidarum NRRL Y-27907]|uniref:2-dehydropantolactone reductase n=1 Tax=Spathaspora passalidarum (strain NRRL Y-27907 / 11-Y1) TaxID=619300 RepID=G3AKH6_SPAPN|nr:uncharacterized protein SPAPADRAFT_60276 [Spathaspora passalidarum NRRL Y-27907]EGW32933.1 hypothetical protein SPAPADRAFT_60276 [Spathaspora passalidarum NRRL Y-27907]